MFRFLDKLNLTPTERRVVVAILVVAFVVLNYWLVWPRFGDWGQIRKDIEAMRKKQDLYQREITRGPVHEATVRKLQGQGSTIPTGEEAINFRDIVDRLARETGVSALSLGQVTTNRPFGTATNVFFDERTLQLRALAAESALIDFLERLGATNAAVPVRVGNITLGPGGADRFAGGPTNLNLTVDLIASFQKGAPPKPVSRAPAVASRPATQPVPPSIPAPKPLTARTNTAPVRNPNVVSTQ